MQTVTVLISVTQNCFAALENGKEIFTLYFDYQKATDNIHHAPLLTKLTDSFQLYFKGSLTITNRMQFVVNGAMFPPNMCTSLASPTTKLHTFTTSLFDSLS